MLIFNWEVNEDELRIHDPATNEIIEGETSGIAIDEALGDMPSEHRRTRRCSRLGPPWRLPRVHGSRGDPGGRSLSPLRVQLRQFLRAFFFCSSSRTSSISIHHNKHPPQRLASIRWDKVG